MPQAEWEALERQWERLQKEDPAAFEKTMKEAEKQYADANYSPVDVRDVPRFCPRNYPAGNGKKGMRAFVLLSLLLIGFLSGGIYIF